MLNTSAIIQPDDNTDFILFFRLRLFLHIYYIVYCLYPPPPTITSSVTPSPRGLLSSPITFFNWMYDLHQSVDRISFLELRTEPGPGKAKQHFTLNFKLFVYLSCTKMYSWEQCTYFQGNDENC
jgi:hypothetical protein